MHQEEIFNPKIVIIFNKQMNELMKKSPEGVTVIPNDKDPLDIEAEIEGPIDTPYYGGIFKCKLVVSGEFPTSPPKGYFLTKIFHPNISEKGEICVNTLKKDWDPKNWSLYNIFEVIKCLLIFPFPESALNEEAARLFMDNYQEYFKYAKLLTELYAQNKERKHTPAPLLLTKNQSAMDSKYSTRSSPIKEPASFLSSSLDIENFNAKLKKQDNNQITSPFNLGKNEMEGSNGNNEEVLTTVTNFSVLGSNSKGNLENRRENEKKKWMKRI